MRLLPLALALVIGGPPSASAGSYPVPTGRIFFQTVSSGPSEWFVNPNGSRLTEAVVGSGSSRRELTNGSSLAFSPDGRRIATPCVVKPLIERVPGICLENIDGTGMHEITHPPRNSYQGDSEPAWSRDGARIAFVRSLATGNVSRPEETFIWVVNATGTGEQKLPEPYACRHDRLYKSYEPSWGPRGELVYKCDSNMLAVGVMIAADVTNPAVPSPCGGLHPHFSPDGTRIIEPGSADGMATFSSTVRRNSAAPEVFECDWQQASNVSASSAVWSPDGKWIAYLDVESRSLWITRADGGGDAQLVYRVPDRERPMEEQISWLPCGSGPFLQCLPGSVSGPAPTVSKQAGGGLYVTGTDGPDHLIGTAATDYLHGAGGDDVIDGLGNWDALDGGPGNDTIDGGPGNDQIIGGPGADRLLGAIGDDQIMARDGERDTISCGSGRDYVQADKGDDVAADCESVIRQ